MACACADSPRPEIPPGEVSGSLVRSPAQLSGRDQEALALTVGDSIVHSIESSFLLLAERQPQAEALFVAQPDKLPAVQVLLERYNAQLERMPLSQKEEKRWKRPSSLFSGKPSTQALVKENVSFYVYQRPIQVRRRNCASCEEPSLLNFMATDLHQLRVFSTQGKPEGYEVGAVTGKWVIHFPKQGL